MIADMIIWGFFSAMGWMGANWTIEKIFPDKEIKEEQFCSDWKEEKQENGKIHRTRTCEPKVKNTP